MWQQRTHDGVPGFVVGDELLRSVVLRCQMLSNAVSKSTIATCFRNKHDKSIQIGFIWIQYCNVTYVNLSQSWSIDGSQQILLGMAMPLNRQKLGQFDSAYLPHFYAMFTV